MRMLKKTYLGHATPERYSSTVLQDAFRREPSIDSMIRVFVDESSEFRLDLELNPATRYLLHILIVDDMNE